MNKIIICVKGGVVQNVHATEPVEVYLYDDDNMREEHETFEEYESARDKAEAICKQIPVVQDWNHILDY